ncbi:MAG: hypothetical protein AMJ54_00655 [Deltaproteobacteria bacterium SG8_13]|nr:MAG: hypothetical protein AMJ54_00655 [Deltaproteobacteria bacterium SG8_13]
MKKQMIIFTVSVFLSFPVFSAETTQPPQNSLTEQVRQNTRLMIRAGVPEEQAVQMVQTMERQQVREEQIVRAQQMVMNANKQGLPVGPMISKAMEGLAKGVSTENTLEAMEQVADRYSLASRHARQLAADEARQEQLRDMIADCLAAGIRDRDLDRIMEQLQQRSRQMSRSQTEEYALATMQNTRTMARMAVKSSVAADVVCAALQNRYTTREMQQLHEQFIHQSRQASPNQVATAYARAISGGDRGGSLGQSGSGDHGSGSGDHGGGSGDHAGGSGGSGGAGGSGNSGGAGGSGKK